MFCRRSESFEKSVELSVEEARKQYALLKQRAKDKLDSVRWNKSEGEAKSPSTSLPDLTVPESNVEYRTVRSVSLDSDDSDLDGAPASAMEMIPNDPCDIHVTGIDLTSEENPPVDQPSPTPEVEESPLAYRSLIRSQAVERSVEEARKQYLILKQKAKDKLDSIRHTKSVDEAKPISPTHVPQELISGTGEYRSPNLKGLEGLEVEECDFDKEVMTATDNKEKLKKAKGRPQVPNTGKIAAIEHVTRTRSLQKPVAQVTRADDMNREKAKYGQGQDLTNARLEAEKYQQEIVKLAEETRYFKYKQRLCEEEREIFKLQKEKLKVEMEILEKRLIGHIKQTHY